MSSARKALLLVALFVLGGIQIPTNNSSIIDIEGPVNTAFSTSNDVWNESPFRTVAVPGGFNLSTAVDYSDVVVLINNQSEMKIKTIFKINIALSFLQALPLYISLFSPEFKMMLTSDAFGSDPSPDALIIFEQFALVIGLLVLGVISLIYGSLSFNDISVLKRLSFLFFALSGFFALPDLINVFTGQPTAPLPVIIMGLVTMGLFYYGSKKGTI